MFTSDKPYSKAIKTIKNSRTLCGRQQSDVREVVIEGRCIAT
jgi:hypothetical protein